MMRGVLSAICNIYQPHKLMKKGWVGISIEVLWFFKRLLLWNEEVKKIQGLCQALTRGSTAHKIPADFFQTVLLLLRSFE